VLKKQVISFILVGILNTIVGYSLYAFFIFLGFNYLLSVLFATILGIIFNFKTIGKLVFNNSNKKLFFKFIITYIIVFFINVFFIKIFRSYGLNDYLAGFLAILPCAIISFMLNKYYVFKEKNETN